jgi:hypothetical protein
MLRLGTEGVLPFARGGGLKRGTAGLVVGEERDEKSEFGVDAFRGGSGAH